MTDESSMFGLDRYQGASDEQTLETTTCPPWLSELEISIFCCFTMMQSQFLRIKKLTGKGIVLKAAKHNLREILAEKGIAIDSHIDWRRINLNEVLRGPRKAIEVDGLSQALMTNAGIKTLRKDAVRALEILFSVPPDAPIESKRFFDDCVRWTELYFAVPILSAVVHNDEAVPHCHVLLLPLVNGRMNGSDLLGNRTKLQGMQTAFHIEIGQKYGLSRPAPRKRYSLAARKKAANQIIDAIKNDPSLLNQGQIRSAFIGSLVENPEPVILSLGMDMPKVAANQGRTFTGIMIRKVKPEKTVGIRPAFPETL